MGSRARYKLLKEGSSDVMKVATLGSESLGRPSRRSSARRAIPWNEKATSNSVNVSCRCALGSLGRSHAGRERVTFLRGAKNQARRGGLEITKGVRRTGPQRAQSQQAEEQGKVRSRLGTAPPKIRGDYAPDGRSYLEEYDVSGCETTTMPGSSSSSPPVISPVVVTKMIESLAIGHFQKLSGDYSDVPRSKEMNELNLTFMLSRITFEFSELPQSNQALEAETLFKPQKVSFKRDFAVRNKTNGSVVAAATSTYVLVNFVTRKISIAPKEVVDLYKDYSTKDTSRLGVTLPRKSKLSAFTSEEGSLTKSYVVEESDIDLNGHVGASVYINWILDSAQASSLGALRTLDIEYKQECFVGQNIECYIQTDPSTNEEGKREVQHLVQTKEGEMLLRAKSIWTA